MLSKRHAVLPAARRQLGLRLEGRDPAQTQIADDDDMRWNRERRTQRVDVKNADPADAHPIRDMRDIPRGQRRSGGPPDFNR